MTSFKVTTGVPHRFSHVCTTLRQVHSLSREQLFVRGVGDKKNQVQIQTKIKKIMDKLFYYESQNIILIKNNGTHSFPDNTLEILSKSTAQQLKKKYTFQADPFLTEKGDKLYVFYEALSFHNSKDALQCHVLDRELVELGDIRLKGLDDLQCHLSFPYLIHISDQLFMVPESSEREGVILFQSIELPTHQKQVKTLISDTQLTNNVFISISEACYLLSTVMDSKIIIHSVDHVYGQWRRVTPSLKVSNPRHQGTDASYQIEDKMYLLIQEYTPETYGRSIYVKELVTLNDTNFAEAPIEQINSSINHSGDVHTLNFSSNYTVYNTKVNEFSLLAVFKKTAYKCMIKYRDTYLTRQNN